MKTWRVAHAFVGGNGDDARRWQSFGQALLMTNEFVFVD